MGVVGTGFAETEASDNGGDGGVASASAGSGCVRGGVDAVGDDRVVADVDASDTGERGRNELLARILDVLRSWCRSIVSSARRSFSCTISVSMRRSDSSSRSR
jgi:hypothetical protein